MIDTFPPPSGNGVAAPAFPERFRLWTVEEICEREPPPWLIGSDDTAGVLPAGQLAVLFGPSGLGKTFLALDLAFCTAAGIPKWNGFPVKQGPAVYVAAEGANSLSVRVPALLKHYGLPQKPAALRFMTAPVNLYDPRDLDASIAAIRAQSVAPALIVIDTLARCMLGADENTVKDMAQTIANVDRLKNAFDAAVLMVHHSGKSGDMRGSTALLGAIDKQISVELAWGMAHKPKEERIIRVSSTKTKDGEDFRDMFFQLKTIPVPTKRRPKAKSAVLVRCDPPPREPKDRPEPRRQSKNGKLQRSAARSAPKPVDDLSPEQRVVLQAIQDLGDNIRHKDAKALATRPDREGPTIRQNQFDEAMRVLTNEDHHPFLRWTGTRGTKSVRYSVTEEARARLLQE